MIYVKNVVLGKKILAQRNGPVESQARRNLLNYSKYRPLAGFDFNCFHSFTTLCGFILDFLPIFKGAKSFFGDVGVMDKQVLAAIVRGDETKSLLLVKPLYCTTAHVALLGPTLDRLMLSPRYFKLPVP